MQTNRSRGKAARHVFPLLFGTIVATDQGLLCEIQRQHDIGANIAGTAGIVDS